MPEKLITLKVTVDEAEALLSLVRPYYQSKVVAASPTKEWRRHLACVEHGVPGARKACSKLFYTEKALAAHNAWAHE